jgi:uncharacterized cupin superfamily protein
MKHTILDEAGQSLGTIDIDPERAAVIADAKQDEPSDDGVWHFTAGDWLTDEEIEELGTSHEMDVQIIPATEGGAQ